MSKKPEWFELAGEEPKPNSPATEPKFKSTKRLTKIALLTAPLLIIGGALVFAEGDESDDAPKMDTAIPTATVNSASPSIQVSQASTKNVTANSSVGVTNPATSNSTTNNPGTGVGVPAPSGRNGEEHEGREGYERPRHEGGEHEFGEDDD
jgi:hypothetical protein